MPLPYRPSAFRPPVHQAPPLPPPSTPEELEALMEREMGPRTQPAAYEPVPKMVPRSCRFHPRVWSTAAIYRGPSGSDIGWVLLCSACVSALRDRTLYVVDAFGRYTGKIPPSDVAPAPMRSV